MIFILVHSRKCLGRVDLQTGKMFRLAVMSAVQHRTWINACAALQSLSAVVHDKPLTS
jgi:hypothetical protein